MSEVTDYSNRFAKRYVSFADQPGGPPAAPYSWPQDVLKVPDGFGGVPIINDLNANLAQREPFGLSAQFLMPNGNGQIQPGADILVTLNVPADGDFWLDSIAAMFPKATNAQSTTNDISSCLLQITDVGTGYKLFPSGPTWDGCCISAFSCFQRGAFDPIPGQPIGAGQRTSMIQPYCFLRRTSIEIRLTNPAQGFPSPISAQALGTFVNLMGWKEYAYAAQK